MMFFAILLFFCLSRGGSICMLVVFLIGLLLVHGCLGLESRGSCCMVHRSFKWGKGEDQQTFQAPQPVLKILRNLQVFSRFLAEDFCWGLGCLAGFLPCLAGCLLVFNWF